ncbi:MAG: LacI family DNA-binding transcriptional regulator [Opitutales bacterium]
MSNFSHAGRRFNLAVFDAHRSGWGMAVTVADIARRAGVAYSTASLALRGVGSVAPATRARVLAAGEALGYRRNAAASLLARQRRRAGTVERLGLAWLKRGGEGTEREAGALRAAERLGYELSVVSVGSRDNLGLILNGLWNRSVEGLILDGLPAAVEARAADIDWQRFALVKMGRILPSVRCSLIRTSAFEMAMLAFGLTFEAGHRRVAFLCSGSESDFDDDARIGAAEAFRARRLRRGRRLRLIRLSSVSGLTAALLEREILAGGFTAVIGFPGGGILQRMRGLGLALSGLDYVSLPLPSAYAGGEACAGVSAELASQGEVAVRRVHELLATHQYGIPENPGQFLVSPRWIPGAPSQPPPGGETD